MILAVGGLFMFMALLLDLILGGLFKLPWFKHSQKMRYAYAEWQAGSTLQIQRLAHEGLGLGTWSNTTGTIPVTRREDNLGTLDISNIAHPRLSRPSVELAKVHYIDEHVQGKSSPRYSKLPTAEQA